MAPGFPTLSRPPIIEALIEFSTAEEVATAQLALDPEALLGEGATRSAAYMGRADVLFQSGEASPVVTAESGLEGYRFESAASDRVVQFRRRGLTYSLVGRYTNWGELEQSALGVLAVYSRSVEDRVLVCPATRFINRIEVPFGQPLDRFLRATPPVPAGIGADIVAFGASTQFRDPASGLTATLALASMPQADDATTGGVLLDVSVQSAQSFAVHPADPGTTADLRAELGRIREMKNVVFFGTLASAALSFYQDPV